MKKAHLRVWNDKYVYAFIPNSRHKLNEDEMIQDHRPELDQMALALSVTCCWSSYLLLMIHSLTSLKDRRAVDKCYRAMETVIRLCQQPRLNLKVISLVI